MSALYAETSAVLAWLFGEPRAGEVIALVNRADSVVSSALTGLEVRRSLVRAHAGALLSEAVALHLLGRFEAAWAGWTVMELTPDVLSRASARFPVEPVRSLDAIHLATALQFARALPELRVLSFDARVASNAEPLGLARATPST